VLRVALSFVVVCVLLVLPAPAFARVWVKVDLSQQRMLVYVKGRLRHKWPVSTGRRRYRTPTGTYRPQRLERDYYSRKYNNSPMPHSIFFRGGYAIHGTDYVRQLGRPASHGCVRLSRRNAARLFRLVRRYGRRRVKIAIQR
jgi:lipoprotein-anchoring transpeptidase ErfK/SrfK